jgi:TPR repeat protein
MRIPKSVLLVALLGSGFGLTTAYAFDGTKSPADIAPAVGGGVTPEAPLGGGSGNLKAWARALRAGDIEAAQKSLEGAARAGDVMAAWKLGRMYADGDGVPQSDLRAFEYFRGIANAHADEQTGTAEARFVANAFVALGGYYLSGIPNSSVKPDATRAHEMFNYAASYFGDPDAQYRLGRMLLDGQGGPKDPKVAVRWLSLAAGKGQYQAQAVFGALLFKGQSVPRDAARGLMWLILARDAATPKETWISDLYNAAVKQANDTERAVALVHVEQWMEQSRAQRTP